MDWEDYCRERDGEPVVCRDCGATFDPSEMGEMEGHRDEHWFEWLRSQCPIPPPESLPWTVRTFEIPEDGEEVEF